MLPLWCLSMIQVFSYPLGKSIFHLFVDLKQAIVSVSDWLSPHNFEMFSISPPHVYSFRCWFYNNYVLTFLQGCFPSSFLAEDFIFFSVPLSQQSSFYSFVPEALWCCSVHSSSRIEDRVLSMLIHLTGVLCHLFKFFSSYQVLHLFSTGVMSKSILLCSLFISFQPEWFQVLLVHCTRHS